MISKYELSQKREIIPLFSIMKPTSSLLNLSKEELENNKDVILDYVENNKISTIFPINKDDYTRMSQADIFNLLNKVTWKIVRNNNVKYLVTQYAIFKLVGDEIIPLVVAMISCKYVKYLKMASLIERPFPPELIQLWVNSEHNLTSTFYNRLRATFYKYFNHAKVEVRELTCKEFKTYLYKTYTKPVFLLRDQEKKWKKDLLDEFRKKE